MEAGAAPSDDRLAEHYQALLDVCESIATHHDLSSLCRDLARRLPAVAPFDFIGLILHDPLKSAMKVHVLETAAVRRLTTKLDGLELPLEASASGWVWTHQRVLVIPSLAEETRFAVGMAALKEIGVQSVCLFPLTTAVRRLGAIGFGSRSVRAFEDNNLRILEKVAKQVAVAVDNVLHSASAEASQQALVRERDRLSLLLDITNAVVSHLDLCELLKEISSCLRRVMPHDLAGLALYDSAAGRLLAHVLDFPGNEEFAEAGTPIPLEGTPEGRAFTTRQTVLIKRLSLSEFLAEIVKRAATQGLRSGCAVPLIAHGRGLGTLSVVSLSEGAFSEDDAAFLGRVGAQVAIAVENALAYREIADLKDTLSKEKLYLEDEIRTAYNFEEIVGESAALRCTRASGPSSVRSTPSPPRPKSRRSAAGAPAAG